MAACPSCSAENPDGARFCNACGTLLTPGAAAGEERKVVSVLFVDLVGFTTRSDEADPEDVRATLKPYHARVKQEIERFGGTVEKFIGDAVMAVFGAPVAHEDDPERAVRAALRVLEGIEELNEQQGLELSLRAAVATGDAVVSLAARPGEGEGIATGDVVNVAARLQSEAPVGGLVVAEQTFRATRGAIEYQELEPVTVKGKADPLPLWLALRARSRFGVDAEAAPAMPFVGRDHELRLLQDTFERTLRESTVQLVTIIGEPGVGKTRLLAEFRGWLDDRPELVYWRQGRCLPYGEGIAFWALGEVVKAHAGILESDGPDEASSKLRTAVDDLAEESDREWLTGGLTPLVGLTGETQLTRDESFAVWQRFLEALAAQRLLVLLFEDLHWGDSALLDFVERLVDWSTGLPILVLCSARPELYDLRPGWGGGKRNSSTVALSPLTRDDTARLVSALLESAVLPAETQEALLERSGGNPLYAEEYVRLFRERGSAEDLPLPETVHGLIAARIDSLPTERKALLHDASVLGKVFWAGALEAMGALPSDQIRQDLHQLSQRELVRPMRTSSVEGQAEYAFWHALVRDVAYGQIPRSARAAKHLAAADWIEAMAGERLADHADLVAHHLSEALSLAEAAGEDVDPALTGRAARVFVLAGDRAAKLDIRRADVLYRRALQLTPPDSVEQARVLVKSADMRLSMGDAEHARQDAENAARTLEAGGDVRGAGAAYSYLGRIYFVLGGTDRMERVLERARELLESIPPGPELVDAYGRMAVLTAFQGRRPEESIAWSDKAIALAEGRGWSGRELLNARMWRGFMRCELGDLDGVSDLEQGLAEALELGGVGAVSAYVNLADQVWRQRGPRAALELFTSAIEYARRRGIVDGWPKAESCWVLYDLGEWDELLRRELELRNRFGESSARVQPFYMAATYGALVLTVRGLREEAAACVEDLLPGAREVEDPQVLGPALAVSAKLEHARGGTAAARSLIEEWADVTRDRSYFRLQNLTDAVRVACAVGEVALAERLREGIVAAAERDRLSDLTAAALISEARGDLAEAAPAYREAATAWSEFGCMLESGLALLGLGRCSTDREALERARDVFAGLGAEPLVTEVDALVRGERSATAS